MLQVSEMISQLMLLFLICSTGFAVGRIRIFGIQLGVAGIFLVGLLFGHFGVSLPGNFQTLGLMMFVTATGLGAGSGFFANLRRNGFRYTILCLTTILTGLAICFLFNRVCGMDTPSAVGILTGAFTTSPGFAAAKGLVSGEDAMRLAACYGVAYPVGTVAKILFVQILPRILHADMKEERAKIARPSFRNPDPAVYERRKRIRLDGKGLAIFFLAALAGMLFGSVVFFPGNGAGFSFGVVGGCLLSGLLLSAAGRIGPLSLQTDKSMLDSLKTFGVAVYFACAGTEGGKGVVSVLQVYGFRILFFSTACVMIPLCIGYLMFRYVLKLPLLNGMASLLAGMTCTASLFVLIDTAGTDDVASAYATTYPIALMVLVGSMQLLIKQ